MKKDVAFDRRFKHPFVMDQKISIFLVAESQKKEEEKVKTKKIWEKLNMSDWTTILERGPTRQTSGPNCRKVEIGGYQNQ